jgi:hypothetical protein
VIRGPIWQLMSSSKSSELEETYKSLLKLTSPREGHPQGLIAHLPAAQVLPERRHRPESLFMVVKAYSLYDREVGYTRAWRSSLRRSSSM